MTIPHHLCFLLPLVFFGFENTPAGSIRNNESLAIFSGEGNHRGPALTEQDTGYHFLEDLDEINSLDDVVERMKGKKLYVDVWATWCGPCIQEFGHNRELRELLAKNDARILYISVDKPEREIQWKEMIRHFKLEGYHLRVNEALENDLRKLYGNRDNSVQIPWYLLFNEKGKLKDKNARRPSELKALSKDLDRI